MEDSVIVQFAIFAQKGYFYSPKEQVVVVPIPCRWDFYETIMAGRYMIEKETVGVAQQGTDVVLA